MTRPASIVNFERLYLAALVIDVIAVVIGWNGQVANFTNRGISPSSAALLVIGATVLTIALQLLLWYLVAQRGNGVAKWIIVLLAALSFGHSFYIYMQGWMPGDAVDWLSLASLLMNVVAAWLLFRSDTKAWFGVSSTPTDETAA